MLRILIVILCCYIPFIQAEEVLYKEPLEKDIKAAMSSVNDMLERTDNLVKDDDFKKNLDKQRKIFDNKFNGTVQNLYDFNGISPVIKEDRYISKAMAAGEQIENLGREPWTESPIVLVSFSMPDSAIKALMKEAARIGANIVLRGAIENDISKTIKKIALISKEVERGGMRIDPTLFKRFNITAVPTFILPLEPIKTCDQNGCEVPKHVKATGSASLRYFLEKTARLAKEEERKIAESWLKIYKRGR